MSSEDSDTPPSDSFRVRTARSKRLAQNDSRIRKFGRFKIQRPKNAHATIEKIGHIGSFLGGVSTLVLCLFTYMTFTSWREQEQSKRVAEVAAKILISSNLFSDNVRFSVNNGPFRKNLDSVEGAVRNKKRGAVPLLSPPVLDLRSRLDQSDESEITPKNGFQSGAHRASEQFRAIIPEAKVYFSKEVFEDVEKLYLYGTRVGRLLDLKEKLGTYCIRNHSVYQQQMTFGVNDPAFLTEFVNLCNRPVEENFPELRALSSTLVDSQLQQLVEHLEQKLLPFVKIANNSSS